MVEGYYLIIAGRRLYMLYKYTILLLKINIIIYEVVCRDDTRSNSKQQQQQWFHGKNKLQITHTHNTQHAASAVTDNDPPPPLRSG